MKSVLITGGVGFIGSNLAEHLLRLGYKVVVLDDLSRGTPSNIRACFNYCPNFVFIKGSVLDFDLVERLVHSVDFVFHLAAQVHWEESIIEPAASFKVNTIGTLNMLEAVRMSCSGSSPVKMMLYASSSEVYGTAQYVPMDEEHPFNPQSPYAAGKAGADRLCSAYHHIYKLPVVILRQFNTYGPNQSRSGYSAVIPKFTSQVLNGISPTIYGDGTQTKDFHYIDDLLNAYSLILEGFGELDLFGMAINFGTGVETSINKLAKMILEIAPTQIKEPLHLPPRPGEVMRFMADITLAKKALGFKPKVELREGLSKYIEWFVSQRHMEES